MKQPAFTTNMEYHIVAVDLEHAFDRSSTFHYDTVCGTAHLLASLGSSAVKEYYVSSYPSHTDSMSHVLSGLAGGRQYRVMIYAECNEECLKQISETYMTTADISCTGQKGELCTPVNFMYSYTDITTQADTASTEEVGKPPSYVSEIISVGFLVVAALFVALMLLAARFSFIYLLILSTHSHTLARTAMREIGDMLIQ